MQPHIHSRVGGSGGNNTQSEMVSPSIPRSVNERASKERSYMDLPATERFLSDTATLKRLQT
jgi:hypothetical protein